MRFQENKKEKFLRNRLIRQQFKSNQLEEEFKEIKMISEVFRDEQVVAQAENKVRPASKDKHSLPKQGSKRVKMN